MKFRRGKKSKQHHDTIMNDGETQCGSQVPLFHRGKSSDASVATTVMAASKVSPSPIRKRSFLGRMKRSRSCSRPQLAKPRQQQQQDEEWVQPWQDVSMEGSPTESTASSKQSAAEEEPRLSPGRSVGGVSVPVGAQLPFGGDGFSGDLISSWIHDEGGAAGGQDTEAERDAMQESSLDDNSTLSSRGTGGSLFTYASGYFSNESSGYTTASTVYRGPTKMVNESLLTESSDGNSLAAHSQSTMVSSPPPEKKAQSSQPAMVKMEEIPTDTKEKVTMYERVVVKKPETKRKAKEKKKKPPTIGEVMSDIGVVAGEIYHDVRESVSCVVDTTTATAKNSNCV